MPSLLEALEKKYGWQGSGTGPARIYEDLPVAIFVPKRSPRLSVPTLLVLNDCDIESAGDGEELRDKCCDVEELDLAKNKLTKWGEVIILIVVLVIKYVYIIIILIDLLFCLGVWNITTYASGQIC